MILQLRQWVSALPELRSSIEDAIQSTLDDNQIIKFRELAYLPIWPIELIEKAGFKDIELGPANMPGHLSKQLQRMQDYKNNVHKLDPPKKKNKKETRE